MDEVEMLLSVLGSLERFARSEGLKYLAGSVIETRRLLEAESKQGKDPLPDSARALAQPAI